MSADDMGERAPSGAGKTGRARAARCWSCGRAVEALTAVSGTKTATPLPGSWLVCVYCGALSRYHASGYWRKATDADVRALDAESRAEVFRVRKVLRAAYVRRYGHARQ